MYRKTECKAECNFIIRPLMSDKFEVIRLWAIKHVICGSCHLLDAIVLVLG
jgi:hypothetical protein